MKEASPAKYWSHPLKMKPGREKKRSCEVSHGLIELCGLLVFLEKNFFVGKTIIIKGKHFYPVSDSSIIRVIDLMKKEVNILGFAQFKTGWIGNIRVHVCTSENLKPLR